MPAPRARQATLDVDAAEAAQQTAQLALVAATVGAAGALAPLAVVVAKVAHVALPALANRRRVPAASPAVSRDVVDVGDVSVLHGAAGRVLAGLGVDFSVGAVLVVVDGVGAVQVFSAYSAHVGEAGGLLCRGGILRDGW